MEKLIIAPSILSADFSKIVEEVKTVEKCNLNWLHIDVMDGQFVPNITFGPKFVKDLRCHTDLYFDAHLMINNPENFIDAFSDAGCNSITIHSEATNHLHRALQMIVNNKVDCGVSLNPATSVDMIKPVLPMLDQVLVMTVNPGFGGQSFIDLTLDKIKQLVDLKEKHGYKYKINLDGGINLKTIEKARKAGCDVCVTGSAFFNATDREGFVDEMLKISLAAKK
jgi:ribulose-phosphate 3-epimerase